MHVGMEDEADPASASLEQALFWRDVYSEILGMEESAPCPHPPTHGGASLPRLRREVELTNVPVVVAQVERFQIPVGNLGDSGGGPRNERGCLVSTLSQSKEESTQTRHPQRSSVRVRIQKRTRTRETRISAAWIGCLRRRLGAGLAADFRSSKHQIGESHVLHCQRHHSRRCRPLPYRDRWPAACRAGGVAKYGNCVIDLPDEEVSDSTAPDANTSKSFQKEAHASDSSNLSTASPLSRREVLPMRHGARTRTSRCLPSRSTSDADQTLRPRRRRCGSPDSSAPAGAQLEHRRIGKARNGGVLYRVPRAGVDSRAFAVHTASDCSGT